MGAPPRNDEGRVAATLGTAAVTTTGTRNSSPFADRRKFLIWAAMCGCVGPERVTERILAELAEEGAQ